MRMFKITIYNADPLAPAQISVFYKTSDVIEAYKFGVDLAIKIFGEANSRRIYVEQDHP